MGSDLSQDSSLEDSSIHQGTNVSFQALQPNGESLLMLQNTDYPLTDVIFVDKESGKEVKCHRCILNMYPFMKKKIDRQKRHQRHQPQNATQDDHIRMELPDGSVFSLVLKCILMAYLGEVVKYDGRTLPMKWFGLTFQSFTLDPTKDPKYCEQLDEKMGKFWVRYRKRGQDFLMNARGKIKGVPSSGTSIKVYCNPCGKKFYFEEQIKCHYYQNTTCKRDRRIYDGEPSYDCQICKYSFVLSGQNQNLPRNDTLKSISPISGGSYKFNDSIRGAEFYCIHCCPAPSTSSTPLPMASSNFVQDSDTRRPVELPKKPAGGTNKNKKKLKKPPVGPISLPNPEIPDRPIPKIPNDKPRPKRTPQVATKTNISIQSPSQNAPKKPNTRSAAAKRLAENPLETPGNDNHQVTNAKKTKKK